MALSISSVWLLFMSLDTGGSFPLFGGGGTGLVAPSGCCAVDFNGRDWKEKMWK